MDNAFGFCRISSVLVLCSCLHSRSRSLSDYKAAKDLAEKISCFFEVFEEESFCNVSICGLSIYLLLLVHSAIVGEIDVDLDSKLDLDNIKAEPLHQIVH